MPLFLKSTFVWTVAAGLVLLFALALYFLFWRGEAVYFQIVDKDGPGLSVDMQNWLAAREDLTGTFVYALESEGYTELLIFDNRHEENNRYVLSTINARLYDGTLRVEIDDGPPVSKTATRYNLKTYFILKETPEAIEITVNGEPQEFEYEVGLHEITR
jgi:hypothetical protein